jgi:hypothetical protein
MATIVVPWLADRYREGADWRALAWWIHDHLPYSQLQFFPNGPPLTSAGMSGHGGASTALSPRRAA